MNEVDMNKREFKFYKVLIGLIYVIISVLMAVTILM